MSSSPSRAVPAYRSTTVNYSTDLVLVTAASGKQVSDVLPHLVGQWKRIRLQVASEQSKKRLQKEYPGVEVVQADLTDAAACHSQKHEPSLPENIIDAAVAQKASGGPFTHLVYSSVIHPTLHKMLNHDAKRQAEEYLIESGLDYTILQPTHLCETFPVAKVLQEEHPTYPANWDPKTRFSFCTTKDLGEAAARILEQREKHYAATYEAVSTPDTLSYIDVVAIMSKTIGKEIRIERQPLEQAVETMANLFTGGQPTKETKEGLARMFLYYNERGLVGNKNVLEMVLGRPTMTYQEWASQKVREVREQIGGT